jgi:hypothetical protein
MKSMNKKLASAIVVAGITFTVAGLNMRLNTQGENRCISLLQIEALSEESSAITDVIELHGSLIFIPVKSYSQPFQAIKYSSHINVYYSVNLSNITIQIVKGSGQTVYSNTVNPVAGGQLYISLAGLTSGDYTIVFTAPNGNSIYGYFEI